MNFKKTTLLILAMTFSVFVYSEEFGIPYQYKSRVNFADMIITPVKYHYESKDHHTHPKKYTWYLTINIEKLRQTGILDLFNKQTFNLSEQILLQLNELPKELNKVILFGNTFKRSGEVSAYLIGNLSDSALEQYITTIMSTENGQSKLKNLKRKTYSGNEQLVFENTTKDKKLYAKKVRNDVYIISNKIIYTKNKYSYKRKTSDDTDKEVIINNSKSTSLLEIVIDSEQVQKNMKLNLDENGYIMQSKIFTKAKNIVAEVFFKDEDIIIGSALTTNDEKIAIQIKKILEGITAYSSLTSAQYENTAQSILMNNMVIERKEKNVLIETYVPLKNLIKSK